MSDLREQLQKAGLVSAKQVRQAKHQDRLHRAEVGHEGLEAEKAEREQAHRRELEERRRRDQEREEAHRKEQAVREQVSLLQNRIRAGWIREATGGARRFFFVAEGGRITYLDLTDQAVRRLQSGSAAVIESRGAVRGEFCVIDGGTASSLVRDHAGILRLWNRTPDRS
jgi:uncharacterized protein YaiL (DUF2058 family)